MATGRVVKFSKHDYQKSGAAEVRQIVCAICSTPMGPLFRIGKDRYGCKKHRTEGGT